MTNHTNTYFQTMNNAGEAYEAARVARRAERDALMEAEDREGLKAWNEREKAFPFPFSIGAMKAYRAWKNSTISKKQRL